MVSRPKKRQFSGLKWLQKRRKIVGERNKQKTHFYYRHVDFRDVENAFFKHTTEFWWEQMIQFSTVFKAERDQTKLGNAAELAERQKSG